MEGISLKGDFEQRRSGWGETENKAACSECGNTGYFKAHRPIWVRKKKRWVNENPTTSTKGGRPKGPKGEEGEVGAKAVRFTHLESEEKGPENKEIPGNEVNLATRSVNLANALGAGNWERKNWA